jgi:hypothetical protein
MDTRELAIAKGRYVGMFQDYNWDWWGYLSIPSGRHSRRRILERFDDWRDELQLEEGGRHFRWVRAYERGRHGEDDSLRVLIGGLRSRTRQWEQRWSNDRMMSSLSHFKKDGRDSRDAMYNIVDLMDKHGELDLAYDFRS